MKHSKKDTDKTRVPEESLRCRISVRVQPRASRSELIGEKEGVWNVRLTAPPVEGAANKACIELMAECLGVKRGQLQLVAGEKSRDKVIQVEGLSLDTAMRRLRGE